MTRRLAIIAAIAALAVACSAGSSGPSGAPDGELTVFAAASLGGMLDAAEPAFEAAHPGTKLTVATDSSAALATQIEQGAPADIFLSADTANPQKLVEGGFASGDAVVFAANELCVVVPAATPSGLATPADLAKPGIKVIAAGDEVPITKYASELIANLAAEPGYPAGFEAAYAANVVSREDNVKAVVAKIELGEGDAAVVYVTDARASSKVRIIDVPDHANVQASYAGIVVGASPRQEPARAFLSWLAGGQGQAILGDFGFLPPPS